MAEQPTDIILLSHNRLDHLSRTVEALEERTRAPFRLSVVDNASAPEVRNWLAENRRRFARLILRPSNEHVPGFQHGIEASDSDPVVVSDPDLVVPDSEPCWLTRVLELFERHPDFGLIGLGLDPANRPPLLPPEEIDPGRVVDDELVEGDVGTWFQTIRRDALPGRYYSDADACSAARRAGYRVGWARRLRAFHLGWDDYRAHPEHLLKKHVRGAVYTRYAELEMVTRPPTLAQIALAAPVLAELDRAQVAPAAVAEVSWDAPLVGAVAGEALSIRGSESAEIPLETDAAGAVGLVNPPASGTEALLAEAARVATRIVVAMVTLADYGGRAPSELAPPGWVAREEWAVGDQVLSMATRADQEEDRSLPSPTLGRTCEWVRFFAAGAFESGERRLLVLDRDEPPSGPDRVLHDPERLPLFDDQGVLSDVGHGAARTFKDRVVDAIERLRAR